MSVFIENCVSQAVKLKALNVQTIAKREQRRSPMKATPSGLPFKAVRLESKSKRAAKKGVQLRKILSDVDDTLFSSGGRFPAGIDRSFGAYVLLLVVCASGARS